MLFNYKLWPLKSVILALKISNGTYIVNGEFAISAPGTYDAVGARFTYTRVLGLDSIFAHGPIHYPIDIMVSLFTSSIKSLFYRFTLMVNIF